MRKRLLIAACVLAGITSTAQASVIPVLSSVTEEGGLFRFSYEGTLSGDQGFLEGSRLIIFDFAGFAGGVMTPSPNIIASTELVSSVYPDPGGVLPVPGYPDDPNILNLVFTWVGPPFQASGGPFPDLEFAGLSALSTYSGVKLTGYSARAVTNNGTATGLPAYNVGEVGAPTVPEPRTWAMMLVGFMAVGHVLRQRGTRRGRRVQTV
ncbi:PEPxxWA-CTERM sorting domain-containing protein [Edaphosphingomonas haloaromaticamans]|uniref:PEP-CTERM protein-sorting domain-containing protein n=1 Tax=Edaphosphingomonas haloaromaticamans TaxID=653954 RepID=A0A1S1HEQ1_9SPHN|nr:PEPxxWA-CTERM sorting domain-containing protein [Sphingomonas haloaromaticamans]OHT19976.1 hypothetical protein BHE75_01970 [Sphingomonas haloaromaticamans]